MPPCWWPGAACAHPAGLAPLRCWRAARFLPPAPRPMLLTKTEGHARLATLRRRTRNATCQDLPRAHQGGRTGALNEAFSPYCQGSSPPSSWSHAPRSLSGGGTNPCGRPAAASCPRQRRLHLSTGERVSAVHIGAASLTWPLRMKRGWRLIFCDDLHPSHPTAAQVSQLWDERGAVVVGGGGLRTCGASAGGRGSNPPRCPCTGRSACTPT